MMATKNVRGKDAINAPYTPLPPDDDLDDAHLFDAPEALPTVEEIATASAKRSPLGGWAASDVQTLQLLIAAGLVFLTARASNATAKSYEYALRDIEAERLAEPAARILVRHIKVRVAGKGDLGDILVIAAVSVAYLSRITEARERAQAAKEAEKTRPAPAPAQNGTLIQPTTIGFVP